MKKHFDSFEYALKMCIKLESSEYKLECNNTQGFFEAIKHPIGPLLSRINGDCFMRPRILS